MEKLKEDCIITDERLEYMKAIAELYVPNLEAEIYKNICTTTALPIFIIKIQPKQTQRIWEVYIRKICGKQRNTRHPKRFKN